MKKEETQRNRKEDMHNMDETIKELQKKLDWYTDEATEEEFDAKEVEAILYLLDKWVPIDEEQIPDVDEAWQNFQKRISETEVSAPEEEIIKSKKNEKRPVLFSFRARKSLVAAALLVVVLAVSGTVRVEAIKNSGFFQWLRKDITGMQMVTSPINLENELEPSDSVIYYDRDNLTSKNVEWLEEIEGGLNISEEYKWNFLEVEKYKNFTIKNSCYQDMEAEHKLVMGVIEFADKVTNNIGVFVEYDYIQSYNYGQGELEVYCREEKSGKICYRVCFSDEKGIYYVDGEDLEQVKRMAEQYYLMQ